MSSVHTRSFHSLASLRPLNTTTQYYASGHIHQPHSTTRAKHTRGGQGRQGRAGCKGEANLRMNSWGDAKPAVAGGHSVCTRRLSTWGSAAGMQPAREGACSCMPCWAPRPCRWACSPLSVHAQQLAPQLRWLPPHALFQVRPAPRPQPGAGFLQQAPRICERHDRTNTTNKPTYRLEMTWKPGTARTLLAEEHDTREAGQAHCSGVTAA